MTDAPAENKKVNRRSQTGVVASISGDKTIRVFVNNLVKHPTYGKYVRRRSKLAVHDPGGTAAVGDVVEILPCRRLSKTKAYRLKRVVRSSEGAGAAGQQ